VNILSNIIKQKQKELIFLKQKTLRKSLICASGIPREILNFKDSISKPSQLNIIGEIKRSSPSAGIIKRDFDPCKIARVYEKNGVCALSVLTDEKFFGGNLAYIKLIKKEVKLPILRKDFIIDDYQIYESYIEGADAILLIAQVLSKKELKNFVKLTEKLGMYAVVEIHTKADLFKALESNAQIIGVNNRNLRTFKVDLQTTHRLAKLIPKDRIIVSESGIKTRKDLLTLKKEGIHAVLIGEAFMRASNLDKKIKSLLKGIK
jgi:indole-3-glycerol phosphate synthase